MSLTEKNQLHVLVIAHPDDESMFFLPMLRSLRKSGEEVWILCLTTGDYDGLGKQREKEIHRAAALLDIPKVIVKNDLKDHPTERWPIASVATAIEKALSEHIASSSHGFGRIVLTTFDQYGVSGHVNHIDTHYGVCELIRQNRGIQPKDGNDARPIPVEAWQLESERNLVFKYVPVLCWILFFLSLFHLSLPTTRTSRYPKYQCLEPWINWSAMRAHESQFVWYRRLFVIFSVYTYSNDLRPIIASKDADYLRKSK
jgi:N-acetylglucosaminylphosphatidylinositol deacetylase